MSSKTRTRKIRTTTTTTSTIGPGRTLRSVPVQTTRDQPTAAKVRTDAEDKLWAALHAAPNSTAADLSGAAKIGKSTAQKILVKWAGDGSVTRTAGIADGGRRAADLWAITKVDTAATVDQGCAPADETDTTDSAQAASDSPNTTDTATPAGDDPTKPTNTEPSDAGDDAPDTAGTTAGDPAEAEPAVPEMTEPTNEDAATDADKATYGGAAEKPERLAPGALRGMVEDYLRDHPGEEFGPAAIANALNGKSSGAVSNALDKLVEDNTAVKTQDKPRRFALAPAEAAAAPAPTN